MSVSHRFDRKFYSSKVAWPSNLRNIQRLHSSPSVCVYLSVCVCVSVYLSMFVSVSLCVCSARNKDQKLVSHFYEDRMCVCVVSVCARACMYVCVSCICVCLVKHDDIHIVNNGCTHTVHAISHCWAYSVMSVLHVTFNLHNCCIDMTTS